jgi:4-amino-4-deoxy-L-arabinose transferase-like glycosyltransferase
MLAKRVWLLFLLAIIASYFYGLGRPPLLGPDEPRYAQVAREMFERGDVVTPTLSGHTWFEKPALLYWMMIASYRLFGVNEFAARFGPACSGLVCILLLFWVGRRAERATEEKEKSRGLGQWSSLALATTAGMIGFSRGASSDIVVSMTVTLALSCFYVSEVERDVRRRLWLLAGFYAAVGASLLAKGLVGIVIPFGVVATYFLARRKLPDRHVKLSMLWGVPLFIAIASTWYGPVIARHGWLFIDDFFLQHHLARFVSNKYHHPQPFYFYVLVMIMLAFPWTPFVVGAFRDIKPSTWRKNDAMGKLHVFALAWLIIPVLFFSLSVSKLPGYVLPALPGAVLLAGVGLVSYLRGDSSKLVMRVTALLVLCVVIAGTLYARQMQLVSSAYIILTAAPLALAGIFCLLRAQQRRASVIVLVVGILASTVIAVLFIGDRIGERESIRHLMQIASARGYGDSPVYGLHTIEHTAEFYAAGRFVHSSEGKPVRLEGPQQVRTAAKESNRAVLVLVPVEHLEQLTGYAQVDAEVIGDNGSVALVAVRSK